MSNLINIDVNMVETQAKELENLSTRLSSRTIKSLNDVVMNTRAAWTGDAAAFFDQYMTDGSTNLEQFSKTLKQYAESLRAIAKQARQAQAAAKQQAGS